jgi:hypothetical protein
VGEGNPIGVDPTLPHTVEVGRGGEPSEAVRSDVVVQRRIVSVDRRGLGRREDGDVTFVLFVLPALIIAMALLGFYATKERDRSDPEVRR